MFYVIMSQGTVVLMFAQLLRMSSTAVKSIRDSVKVLMVNSEAEEHTCKTVAILQLQKDIRRDEMISLYSAYYRVSLTVDGINKVFGRANMVHFWFFVCGKPSLSIV